MDRLSTEIKIFTFFLKKEKVWEYYKMAFKWMNPEVNDLYEHFNYHNTSMCCFIVDSLYSFQKVNEHFKWEINWELIDEKWDDLSIYSDIPDIIDEMFEYYE